MPPKILVICGPTASGKTRLAVELALPSADCEEGKSCAAS